MNDSVFCVRCERSLEGLEAIAVHRVIMVAAQFDVRLQALCGTCVGVEAMEAFQRGEPRPRT